MVASGGTTLENIAAAVLFFLQCYHVIGHGCVLFRIRLLPRKDIVCLRYYVFIDGFTVFVTAFLLTDRLRWLASLHVIPHAYYFIFWNQTSLAKKVILYYF